MRITVAMAVACLSMGLSIADEAHATIKKDTIIPAQGLGPALQQLAKDRDVQLVYRSELVGDRQTSGAVGELTFGEALTKLLKGTGLTYQYIDDRAITIVPMDSGSSTPHSGLSTQNSSDGVWERFRLAQAEQGPSRPNKSPTEDLERRVTLEEIIVTAQKREERLQDVPMSIAVISNEDIERRGVIGMEDYLRSIPGVTEIDNGPGNNTIIIRGISTSPEFGAATVGTFFDETPITGAAAFAGGIDVRPVDIERIEVLRGPQGTSYGAASLSGAMRILPVKPKLDAFGGKLSASYSDTGGFGSDNSMIQGVVNFPVVEDTFALRAVGYRYDESGYYTNIAGVDPATIANAESFGIGDLVRGHVQDGVGRMVSTGGRLAALWRATDRLDLSLNFLTQTIEQDGFPLTTTGQYEQTRLPIPPQGRMRGEVGEVSDSEMDLLNLVLNYDLGWAALTSVASWVDGGASQVGTSGARSGRPTYSSLQGDAKSFTAEARLASQLEGRFQFLGGVYYEDVEIGLDQTLRWPGTPETSPAATDPILDIRTRNNVDQHAIFGEVSYDLTEKLTATVGGRYVEYEKAERTFSEGGVVPIGAGVWSAPRETSDSDSSFKAHLGYKPTQNSLLYASWAEGFRLGRPAAGLNSTECDVNGDGLVDGTSVSIESTRHIDSDFLDNYEIGGKFALFDRRMVIDTAVYHIDWEGLPVFTAAVCSTGTRAYTANAGAATSEGVEFQASLFVVEGLRVDFGGGYTKAELSADVPRQGWRKGQRLQGSPEVSANLAAQYDFEVAGYKTFVRADSLYVGDFYGDLQESPALRGGDYIKVDARAGVTVKNLSVEVFVRNLTDEDAFTWQSPFRGTLGSYRMRPRTVGIQLGYSFE